MIEEECGDWWFSTLDRGAGAALHFAAEHGQVTPLLAALHSSVPRMLSRYPCSRSVHR